MRPAAAFVFLLVCQATIISQDKNEASTCGTNTTVRSLWYSTTDTAVTAPAIQVDQVLIFINFNGATVFPGNDNGDTFRSSIISGIRTFPPPSLTLEQQAEVVRRVVDDYSPFNVQVTTSQAEYTAATALKKQMCLVSTQPAVGGFSSDTGGISPFAGPGIRIPNSIVFVFSVSFGNDPVEVANTVSHEIGHALGGLPHQHLYNNDVDCQVISDYHPTFGTGPLSFGPIMGSATGGITNWFGQSCPEPTFGAPIDDFQFLNNQVVLRPDDFQDVGSITVGGFTASIDGILNRSGDVDLIPLNLSGPGLIVVASDNADIEASLFETDGTPLGTFNDPDTTGVIFPVTGGQKILRVTATSNANMDARFMTGQYNVSYLAPTAAAVSVSGRVKSSGGRAVGRAVVRLAGSNGRIYTALTSAFGYFTIDNVVAGDNYVATVSHKTYQFSPRVIEVNDQISDLDFVAAP